MRKILIHPISCKSIFIKMNFQETCLSSGSAFIVDSKYGNLLITNRHNVTGRDQLTNKPLSNHGGLPDNMDIHILKPFPRMEVEVINIPLYDKNNTPRWIEHPVLKERADVVAIPLTELQLPEVYKFRLIKRNFDALLKSGGDIPLYDGDFPLITKVLERVSIVGYPFGIRVNESFPVWVSGYIASEFDVDFDGLPIFLVDSRTRSGQSGSPVIQVANGNLIEIESSEFKTISINGSPCKLLGIYSGRINKDSDLGFVWKESVIDDIVKYFESTH
ncbi:trypsin-like peptidase domain-containing protein [Klebsiella quasipneumoniae]|uniref:trypsin-like peptidase domain-containing protein n=1 Tax=Klebsiella quasipneumoniae TaxID=1463165 RepID=UPI003745E5AB